jgi:hypothetical protein
VRVLSVTGAGGLSVQLCNRTLLACVRCAFMDELLGFPQHAASRFPQCSQQVALFRIHDHKFFCVHVPPAMSLACHDILSLWGEHSQLLLTRGFNHQWCSLASTWFKKRGPLVARVQRWRCSRVRGWQSFPVTWPFSGQVPHFVEILHRPVLCYTGAGDI